jgi:hypothetical protein
MGAQLPSGILLFFALALCLAAVFVFFSGGEGVSVPSALIGIALVVLGGAFVWLMGGEGGQEANRPETTRIAPENTGAAETTSASERTGQSQGETTSYANYCVEKQFSEATRGLDPQQASDYETGVINEAVARAVDPRTVLTERGFPC